MTTGYFEFTCYGGADIKDACREAVRLATLLQFNVGFMFNSVWCCARPGDDHTLLVENWEQALASKVTHKIAYANPIITKASR